MMINTRLEMNQLKIEQIQDYVCGKYNITVDDIKGTSRIGIHSLPRHICMYLIYQFGTLKIREISELYNRKEIGTGRSILKIKMKIKVDVEVDYFIKKAIIDLGL